MLSTILGCLAFLLPICLLVGASELRRKYRDLKEENAEDPGSVPEAELKKWKWLCIGASVVFWCIIAMIVAIPVLFFVAISFM